MVEVIGHRGARGFAPENTIAGFQRACKLGCKAVELDVHLTSDGQLAVIHDSLIDRTTDGRGAVLSFTMEELKDFDAGQGEKIPSLREVFEIFKDESLEFQIELKGPYTEEAAPELTKEFGMVERVTFTSFYHRRVKLVKEKLPGAAGGILVSCNPISPLKLLESACADNLHVDRERIDSALVQEVHLGKKRIIAYGGIVDVPVIERLIELGVDGMSTDRPDLVLQCLEMRSPPSGLSACRKS